MWARQHLLEALLSILLGADPEGELLDGGGVCSMPRGAASRRLPERNGARGCRLLYTLPAPALLVRVAIPEDTRRRKMTFHCALQKH